MVALAFNAHEVEPSSGERQIVPEGWYQAVIIKDEQKEVKDSDGKKFYLAVTMRLQSVETGTVYEGVINRFNLWNDNADTVRIARADLSKLCHVTGVFDLQNTEQLHNIPFQIKVTYQKDKGNIVGNNFPDMRYGNGAEFKKGQNGAPQPNPAQQNPQAFGNGAPAGFAPQGQAPQPPQGQGFGAPPQGFGNPNAPQPPGPAQGFAPPAGAPQQGFAPQGGQAPGFAPQGQAPQAPQAPQGGAPQPWGAGAPGGAPQAPAFGGAPQGGPPQGFAPQGQAPGFAPQAGAPAGFAPQGQAPGQPAFGQAPGAFGGQAPGGQPGGPWGGPPQG